MKIYTFGNCCKKSKENHENTLQAVKELGIDIEVENIGDMNKMLEKGIMNTPAIMINDKLVSSGRALKSEKIIKLIKDNI